MKKKQIKVTRVCMDENVELLHVAKNAMSLPRTMCFVNNINVHVSVTSALALILHRKQMHPSFICAYGKLGVGGNVEMRLALV